MSTSHAMGRQRQRFLAQAASCAGPSRGARCVLAAALALLAGSCGGRSVVIVEPSAADATPALDLPRGGDPPRADRGPLPLDHGIAPADAGLDRAPLPSCAPETCNGLDDDCDGVVDESPGADQSCRLPGAVAACVGGRCLATSCSLGFGECDGIPDNGCELLSLAYPDGDGDGHGDATAAAESVCPGTPARVPVADDCRDDNPDVHPGQTTFFERHRGDGSFDFDCDGQEQPESTAVSGGTIYCLTSSSGASCGVTEGWLHAVPACGAAATYVAGCTAVPCAVIEELRAQRCR